DVHGGEQPARGGAPERMHGPAPAEAVQRQAVDAQQAEEVPGTPAAVAPGERLAVVAARQRPAGVAGEQPGQGDFQAESGGGEGGRSPLTLPTPSPPPLSSLAPSGSEADCTATAGERGRKLRRPS